MLQDSLDHAQGLILRPDFDHRYRLTQDGKRDRISRDYLGKMIWVPHRWMVEEGRDYLGEHPDASVAEFLEHFRTQGEDSLHLEASEDRPGRWVIPRGRAETALWLERILPDGRIDIEDPAVVARDIVTSPEALALLAADDQGQLISHAAELRRRAAGLEELSAVVEDPSALERDLQRALEGQHWIFGGRFVGEAAHRRLAVAPELWPQDAEEPERGGCDGTGSASLTSRDADRSPHHLTGAHAAAIRALPASADGRPSSGSSATGAGGAFGG